MKLAMNIRYLIAQSNRRWCLLVRSDLQGSKQTILEGKKNPITICIRLEKNLKKEEEECGKMWKVESEVLPDFK